MKFPKLGNQLELYKFWELASQSEILEDNFLIVEGAVEVEVEYRMI